MAAGKPLIAVNHLEGHALSPRLADPDLDFPYLLLLVSGGHCQLLLVEGVGRYRRLATTIDDAAGEAFDKTAKLLGLGFPGGPAVERGGAGGRSERRAAAAPAAAARRAAFLLRRPQERGAARARQRATWRAEDIAASLPAGGGRLPGRPHRAGARGAVAARPRWSSRAASPPTARSARRSRRWPREHGLRFVAPPLWLCTDNAAMIAWAGAERFAAGLTDPLDVPARPRWPLDPRRGNGARGRGEGMKLGVIGGGAWGTALAQVAAADGEPVLLWAREPEVVDGDQRRATKTRCSCPACRSRRRSARPAILADLADCDALLVVTPGAASARHARRSCRSAQRPLILCAKGIEAGTRLLIGEVAAEVQPAAPIAVLSGPTFAHEVAGGPADRGDARLRRRGAGRGAGRRASPGPTFRPYLSTDVIGAEIGGAVKNVLAIACGVVEGAGLGQNARAALIARGFAEMTRFGLARGARAETLAGLVGAWRPRPDLLLDQLAQLLARQGARRGPGGGRAARRPPHRGRGRLHRAGAARGRGAGGCRHAGGRRGLRPARRRRVGAVVGALLSRPLTREHR